MTKKNTLSRRDFLKSSAIGVIGAAAAPGLLTSCSGSAKKHYPKADVPELLPTAPNGKPLKAGLIGCGGRGTGAAFNFLDTGNGVEVVMLADIFDDKLQACRQALKEKKEVDIPAEACFVGFDAYKKVIDSDVDVVLLCAPPVFRPAHLEYAVQNDKHIFMEKPCAVDPVGARSILKSGKIAQGKGLSIISGTIRRSQRDCIETYRRVAEGAIGDIVSAQVLRNGSSLWHKNRQKGWSDMEYMMRNWPNFCWVSGDMALEQFIHEIDMASWFLGDKKPVQATAVGGRARRLTGDVYDFYSIQYQYDGGMRSNCTSRQIDGCDNEVSVMVYGTNGSTNCFDTIYNPDGSVAWKYPHPKPEDADQTWAVKDPYVQELIRLVTAIRTGNPVNDAEVHVQSTLMAMMGRMSAYTGKNVTWDEIIASDLKLGPETYAFGPVEGIAEIIPLPGRPANG